MGCNAAKNVTVAPSDGTDNATNGVDKNRNSRRGSKRLGSKQDVNDVIIENAVVNNVQKAESGMSFEITFDETDEKNDNQLPKAPPKRILELQESEHKEPVTLDKIQEKLEEAESRRQQILQQRIQSASHLQKLKSTEMLQSIDGENGNDGAATK